MPFEGLTTFVHRLFEYNPRSKYKTVRGTAEIINTDTELSDKVKDALTAEEIEGLQTGLVLAVLQLKTRKFSGSYEHSFFYVVAGRDELPNEGDEVSLRVERKEIRHFIKSQVDTLEEGTRIHMPYDCQYATLPNYSK